MSLVSDTLFYPFTAGLVRMPAPARIVFMNAENHSFLRTFGSEGLVLQQSFKPLAEQLEKAGYISTTDLPETGAACDLGFLLFPKNMVEGSSMLARLAGVMKEGGLLFCAADNKSGGTRLKKLLQQFGFINIQEASKHKARVVWGAYSGILPDIIRDAVNKGSMQLSAHGFISQAGIFGWDKIDLGSEILAAQIADDLSGKGADFGCGYGYLAYATLNKCAQISSLACVDADARALKAAQENLKIFEGKTSFHWADLTRDDGVPGSLDWIIMNPPFHAGDKVSVSTGQDFIRTAKNCLKTGGVLWMVANVHLPYEQALKENFSSGQKIFEGGGFKVYRAVK